MKQQGNDLASLRARIDGVMGVASEAQLETTVALLRLARLDLMLRLARLTPGDEALVSAVAGKSKATTKSQRMP